jgi:hypothetical protein
MSVSLGHGNLLHQLVKGTQLMNRPEIKMKGTREGGPAPELHASNLHTDASTRSVERERERERDKQVRGMRSASIKLVLGKISTSGLKETKISL